MVPTRWPLLSRLSMFCLALFCIAMVAATWSYGGGSWLHPGAPSHLFWENFWCDLLREPAHNGNPNSWSVLLATLGFGGLAGALGFHWIQVSHLLPPRRARFVRKAGVVSAIAIALIPFVPSDRFPQLHPPAVLTAGGLSFACGCVCWAFALRHFRRAPVYGVTSLALMCGAMVNLLLYVQVVYFQGRITILLPAAQKVATLLLVAWMLAGLAAEGKQLRNLSLKG